MKVVIIQGHPDPVGERFGHALAESYREGAVEAGHEVRPIEIAQLDFPMLRSQADFETGETPDAIRAAQDDIKWADHLVILYPLWIGTMPALLKAFLEQVMRPGFALGMGEPNQWPAKLLKGRSARIVVTMGMPGFVYRWYFRAHSLKSLERNVLGICGIGPIRSSIVGMVEGMGDDARRKWLERMRAFGAAAR